jgi:hypothetical protein
MRSMQYHGTHEWQQKPIACGLLAAPPRHFTAAACCNATSLAALLLDPIVSAHAHTPAFAGSNLFGAHAPTKQPPASVLAVLLLLLLR